MKPKGESFPANLCFCSCCSGGGAGVLLLAALGVTRWGVTNDIYHTAVGEDLLRWVIGNYRVLIYPQLSSTLLKGRKEMFYLTSHSTHFILRLYGVKHMVKERGNPQLPYGLLFPISSMGSFICTIPHSRQGNTYHDLCYTSHGALAGTWNSSLGPPWRIDLTINRTMSERSYHGARPTSRSSLLTRHNYDSISMNWV